MSDRLTLNEEGEDVSLEDLGRNRRQRARLKHELEQARDQLRNLLVEGKATGEKVSHMAEAAGISRDTAHALLREAKEGESK